MGVSSSVTFLTFGNFVVNFGNFLLGLLQYPGEKADWILDAGRDAAKRPDRDKTTGWCKKLRIGRQLH